MSFPKAFLIAAAALCSPPMGAQAPQTPAKMLAIGHADQALAAARASLSANPNDASALNLQCRVWYAEQQTDPAIDACQRAVALEPNDAGYHLWLGRALGQKAQHAPKLKALGIAKRVRAEFEEAHRLAPRNADIASDLAEYYVQAPGIAGGGEKKAEALAAEVEPWAPALAHTLRAELAEKAKKDADAERELTLAAGIPGSGPDPLLALAALYRRQNNLPQMLAAVDRAVAADSTHGAALVSAAALLSQSGQRPQQAIELLRSYLASANRSEDAPAFRVHTQLAGLLRAAGDSAGAERELAAARAEASGWNPQLADSGKGNSGAASASE